MCVRFSVEERVGFCPIRRREYYCIVCGPDDGTDQCVIDDDCEGGALCCHDGCSFKCQSPETMLGMLSTPL